MPQQGPANLQLRYEPLTWNETQDPEQMGQHDSVPRILSLCPHVSALPPDRLFAAMFWVLRLEGGRPPVVPHPHT